MNIRKKIMFFKGGFGTSIARMLNTIPSVRKFATKTPATTVNISMIYMLSLLPEIARPEGTL